MQRLLHALKEHLSKSDYASRLRQRWGYRLTVAQERHALAGSKRGAEKARAAEKPRVFVAMPFKKDFDDVFAHIKSSMNRPARLALPASGRIKKRSPADILRLGEDAGIETADVFIAELSEANPNVYLEIGYAWGKGRLTILLAKSSERTALRCPGARTVLKPRTSSP